MIIPTADGRELFLRRRTEPDHDIALLLDPLTAALCTPAQIKPMTFDLFRAEKQSLPG